MKRYSIDSQLPEGKTAGRLPSILHFSLTFIKTVVNNTTLFPRFYVSCFRMNGL
jgi:hypothetical protein